MSSTDKYQPAAPTMAVSSPQSVPWLVPGNRYEYAYALAWGPLVGGLLSTPNAPTGSNTFFCTILTYAAASLAARFAGSSTRMVVLPSGRAGAQRAVPCKSQRLTLITPTPFILN